MIKIEGTYNTAIVYADTIEAGAEGQIQKLVSQEFTKGSNWNLGSGLSLVLMVFILISMALIAKYDKNGEGSTF